VAVLDGGIRAWQLAGGALEGEGTAGPAWAILSPQQFYNAAAEPGWLVVALSTNAEPVLAGPLPVHGQIQFKSPTLAEDLTRLSAERPGAGRVLLVTPRGERHEELQAATRVFQALPVFYLAGGRLAYERFFRDRLLAEQRQLVTLSSRAPTASPVRSSVRSSSAKCGCRGR
jgi:hypothetical protein